MSNNNLKDDLIKLAYENPELRDELLPLIKQYTSKTAADASYLQKVNEKLEGALSRLSSVESVQKQDLQGGRNRYDKQWTVTYDSGFVLVFTTSRAKNMVDVRPRGLWTPDGESVSMNANEYSLPRVHFKSKSRDHLPTEPEKPADKLVSETSSAIEKVGQKLAKEGVSKNDHKPSRTFHFPRS